MMSRYSPLTFFPFCVLPLFLDACGSGEDLTRQACELHFECLPDQTEYETIEECERGFNAYIFEQEDQYCAEAVIALMECSVEHGSDSCRDQSHSVCDSPFVCFDPGIEDWPCADEEWDVYTCG